MKVRHKKVKYAFELWIWRVKNTLDFKNQSIYPGLNKEDIFSTEVLQASGN